MASDIIAAALHAPFRSFEEADEYLQEMSRRSDVAHLSYWNMKVSDGEPEDIVWLSTYDAHYSSTYMARYTPSGDPVISRMLAGERFVDWREHAPENTTDSELHTAANRVGIYINGFTIGFDDPDGSLMLFSVSGKKDDDNWDQNLATLRERFSAFAIQFHHRMGPLLRKRAEDTWLMAV